MQKYWYILCGAAILVALIQLGIPRVFPICDGMMQTAGGGATPMRCYYTYRAEWMVGIASLLTAIAMPLLQGIEARRVLGAFLILFAALGVAFPNQSIIGLCNGATMPCHITTHWLMIALAAQAFIGVLTMWAKPTPAPEDDAPC